MRLGLLVFSIAVAAAVFPWLMTTNGMMKAVVPEDGKAVVVQRPVPSASGRQVLIKVMYTALNRADLVQVAGKYAPPPGESDILGLECSGDVVSVGPDCTSEKIKVGSRVAALLASGGYADYVAVDERLVSVLPDHMSYQDGVARTEVWLTAFQLFSWVAKIQPSESVLIHAGASSVGLAAIQLCKSLFGVDKILVTAGSAEKIELCKSLGATDGFNYKEQDWPELVLANTQGKGVNVVLDCVGLTHAQGNIKAIAADGRWVLFGLMGGVGQLDILRAILIKRVSLLGSTLRARSIEYKQQLIQAFSAATDDLFGKGQLVPIMDNKYFQGLDSAPDALAYLASNQSKGKVVLKV